MKEFGQYRYNMFKEDEHWFPGSFPTEDKLKMVDLTRCPDGIPLIDMLRETHNELYKPKEEK